MTVRIDPIRKQLNEARQNQILEAASQVFAEKGYHSATLKEIARTAGISEGTVYNYFENKEDLIIQLMNRMEELDWREEQFSQAVEIPFREFFSAAMRHRIEFISPQMQTLQAVLPEILVNPVLREKYYRENLLPVITLLGDHLQGRVDHGEHRPMDRDLLSRSLFSLLLGLVILQLLEDGKGPGLEAYPEFLANLLAGALEKRAENTSPEA